jgi:cobalt-zinc-cadmium efflux system membrane fusion protein
VSIGDQVGDRIIVFSGLGNEDTVAVKGVMQLKGLSFGY